MKYSFLMLRGAQGYSSVSVRCVCVLLEGAVMCALCAACPVLRIPRGWDTHGLSRAGRGTDVFGT